MRVVADVHQYPPGWNAGAERMLHALLRDLVGRGHQAEVYGSRVRVGGQLDGVTIHPRTAKGRVDELYRRADVVVTHLDRSREASIGAHAAGKPVAHLVHNDSQLVHHGLTPLLVDLAVFNSEWVAKAVGWPGPSIVVRPPVHAAEYATARGDRITLINLSEAKGGPLFFDLARRMPHRRFLGVVGAYGVQQIPKVLPANVDLVEHTADVVGDVYARTSVLLVPSSYESWGRVAIEAASSGIPVVAQPTPGLREALGPAGLWADRDELEEWIDALDALDDPMIYRACSDAARARAIQLDPTGDLDRFEAAVAGLVGHVVPTAHHIRTIGPLRPDPVEVWEIPPGSGHRFRYRRSQMAKLGLTLPAGRPVLTSTVMTNRSPRCLVCGAAHAVCGPASGDEIRPVDDFERTAPMAHGPLQRFEIPGRPGHFLRLSEEKARELGILPSAASDPDNEEESALVTSAKTAMKPRARVAEVDTNRPPKTDEKTKGAPRSKKRPAPVAGKDFDG